MKIVLSLSGGLDSAVLLWHLLEEGHQVRCLSVDYGQRHRKELETARKLVEMRKVEHQIANLSRLRFLFAGSSQTSNIDVPEGHYADASMRITVVPNRNMVFLSLAGAWAMATESDAVAYAAHVGDHPIYWDCRPAFTEQIEDIFRLAESKPLKLLRPFIYPTPMDKTAIVKLGDQLGVPFRQTWSCYVGGQLHCGKCGTCRERREAFKKAGITDPIAYEGQGCW